jgi:two-component system sensor histidine kinase/response regulator
VAELTKRVAERVNIMKIRDGVGKSAVDFDELLDRVDRDPQLLRELVDIFFSDCPLRLSALRQAIAEADWKTAEKVSHTLKGMLSNMAAARASSAAAHLELLARAVDAAALPDALASLEGEVALLLPELNVYLAKNL